VPQHARFALLVISRTRPEWHLVFSAVQALSTLIRTSSHAIIALSANMPPKLPLSTAMSVFQDNMLHDLVQGRVKHANLVFMLPERAMPIVMLVV